MAVDGATPKRAAAARQLIPSSIAAIKRSRKSIESGCPIHADLLHPAESMNQKPADLGIPIDSGRSKTALAMPLDGSVQPQDDHRAAHPIDWGEGLVILAAPHRSNPVEERR
jgi:hypothetical protein